MSAALIILPLLAAALAAIVRSGRLRPLLLPPVGAAHLVLTILALLHPDSVAFTRWLALDPPGRIVLLIVSGLFFICSIYSVGYLRYRAELSNRIFCIALLVFLCCHVFAQSHELAVGGGYNYQNSDQGNGVRANLHGWFASAQFDLTSMVSLTAEVDNYYGHVQRQSTTQQNVQQEEITDMPSHAARSNTGMVALALVLVVVATLMIKWEVEGVGARFFAAGWGGLAGQDWTQLRDRWEYSHVARAVFAMVALIALLVAALAR